MKSHRLFPTFFQLIKGLILLETLLVSSFSSSQAIETDLDSATDQSQSSCFPKHTPNNLFKQIRENLHPKLTGDAIEMVKIPEHAKANGIVTIDLGAFASNIKIVKETLKNKVKLCVVLKSNAYGHGIRNLAETAVEAGADCLGIADNEEAKIIRQLGIEIPLVRLRPVTQEKIKEAIPYNVEEIVGSYQKAQEISKLAKMRDVGKKMGPIKIHLNLSSGKSGRESFDMNQSKGREEIFRTLLLPGLQVKGIMSHMATENPDEMRQLVKNFKNEAQEILGMSKLNPENVILHIGASSTVRQLPEGQLGMVRVGGLLYAEPDMQKQVPLGIRPVMSFHSFIKNIFPLKKGKTVKGFNNFKMPYEGVVARIPVGHENGLPKFNENQDLPSMSFMKILKIFVKKLSKDSENLDKINQLKCMIDGKIYPLLSVGQNSCHIDITDMGLNTKDLAQVIDKKALLFKGISDSEVSEEMETMKEITWKMKGLEASISGAHTLKKGQTIGYDKTVLKRDTVVATYPLGYSLSGFPEFITDDNLEDLPSHVLSKMAFRKFMGQKLQNVTTKQRWVSIQGKKFPVLAMSPNETLVDISNFDDQIKEEDKVYFLGGDSSQDQSSLITVGDLTPESELPDRVMIQLGSSLKNRIMVKSN